MCQWLPPKGGLEGAGSEVTSKGNPRDPDQSLDHFDKGLHFKLLISKQDYRAKIENERFPCLSEYSLRSTPVLSFKRI